MVKCPSVKRITVSSYEENHNVLLWWESQWKRSVFASTIFFTLMYRSTEMKRGSNGTASSNWTIPHHYAAVMLMSVLGCFCLVSERRNNKIKWHQDPGIVLYCSCWSFVYFFVSDKVVKTTRKLVTDPGSLFTVYICVCKVKKKQKKLK